MSHPNDLISLSQQWLAIEGDFLSHWQGDLGQATREWRSQHAYLTPAHRQRGPLDRAIQVIQTGQPDSKDLEFAAHTVLALYQRFSKLDLTPAPATWGQWLSDHQGKIEILPAVPEAEITVIMPTYQRCGVLKKAVDSLLQQRDPNWKLLISDDGSTDDTQAWCEQLAQSDERVRYLRQDSNRGFQANYNALCEAATTEWIAYMADDDILMPEWLASVRRLIERFPWVAMAGGGYYSLNYIKGNLKAKQCGPHFRKDTLADPHTELQRCAIEPPLVGGGSLVRRSVIKAISQLAPLDEHWTYQGWDWWLVVNTLSRYELALAPEILLAYVNHSDADQVSFNQDWGAHFVTLCQQLVQQYEKLLGDQTFPPELLRYQLEMVLEPNIVSTFRKMIADSESAKTLEQRMNQQATTWHGFRHLKQEVLPRCPVNSEYRVSEHNISGLTGGHIPGIERGQIRPELQTVIQDILNPDRAC